MTMNAAGMNLVESSEGYMDYVYNDGFGNPTCCWGHLLIDGQTASSWPNPIPQATCVALLTSDLQVAIDGVQTYVNVALNSNQFAALVDFTFNLGVGALQSSTLLIDLNQGLYSDVPAQMLRWDQANGQVVQGLLTRRQNEGILWNTPVGDSTQPDTAAPVPSTALATNAPAAPATNAPVATDSCPGACIDTTTLTCWGSLATGLCPGDTSIQCCEGSVSTCSGTCINTNYQTCPSPNALQSGDCPGGTNIQCCEPVPTAAPTAAPTQPATTVAAAVRLPSTIDNDSTSNLPAFGIVLIVIGAVAVVALWVGVAVQQRRKAAAFDHALNERLLGTKSIAMSPTWDTEIYSTADGLPAVQTVLVDK